MNKIILTILTLFSILSYTQDSKKDENYIRKFAKIAVEEMKEYKIPASITLGQGLLETAFGQSELAQNANNHFGIKCKKEWTGETYRYTDDAYMECFRKYPDAKDSYRDHSLFLTTRKHYSPLFSLSLTDYKGWAYGLKKAGYATNPKYPQILIGRIEKYKLYEFDKLSAEEVEAKLDDLYPDTKIIKNVVKPKEIIKEKPTHKPIIIEEKEVIVETPNQRIKNHSNKNLRYIVIKKDETLQEISNLYGISINTLKKYNDIEDANLIYEKQYLFLEPKKNKGKLKYHKVKEGETMYSIAQKEGIKLEKLYKRNRMEFSDTLKVGEVLNLKGKRRKSN